MTKAEGTWDCVVLNGKAGEADGNLNVQITVQITDGPDKGQRCTYEDTVDTRSAKYVGWSCTAAGWKGVSLKTLEADITAWIAATGGKTTVEIKHIPIKKGKAYDKWVEAGCNGPSPVWDKPAGLGRGAPKPLRAPSAASLKDADEAMRAAMGGAPDEAQGDDSDIPFATCSIRESSPIARVIR